METIGAYRDVVRASLAEFVRANPHPFLVVVGGPLRGIDRSKTRGLTVDRLVLEGSKPPSIADTFLAAPVVCRDPTDTVITVGVSSTCDVIVDDASLSKQHAWLDKTTGGWRIWDNESAAGTLVNDVPLKRGYPQALTSGDKITLGYVDLTFLSNEAFYQLVKGLLR